MFALLPIIGVEGVAFTQSMPSEVKRVMGKYACTSCHALQERLIGPSWLELSKHRYTPRRLSTLMRQPRPENWPDYPPMPPLPHFTDTDAKIIADWLNRLKK